MGIEVERKFLVQNESWRSQVAQSLPMRQGYLNREQRCSVRVRTSGHKGWLNIKGATIGVQRPEFEYEIPVEDANVLLDTLSHQPLIEKVRHLVYFDGHCWEIDEFAAENAGLIVAEVELSHPDEAFVRPDWLGLEVTEDVRYYNTSLSRHPYRQWNIAP